MQAVKALTGSVRLSTVAVPSSREPKTCSRPSRPDCFYPGKPRVAAPLAPPSFMVDGKKVVFADITNVNSTIVFDVKARASSVTATVDFEQSEKGRPVIELVPQATKVTVDGKVIDPKSYAVVENPDGSNLRVIDIDLEPGKHKVEIDYQVTTGIRYSGNGVEMFARKSDLDDRQMDEQYFPTNLEYDQYPGTLTIDVRGAAAKHAVMTNGDVTEVDGKLVVNYPAHFNTASRYLNVIDPANFTVVTDTYTSIDGRQIPITFYTPGNLDEGSLPIGNGPGVKQEPGSQPKIPTAGLTPAQIAARGIEIAKTALAKHEKDFGPYPHPRLLIRNSGSGGMEYCGAIESDLGSIPHELHHQWFARSAQPANGNAGWIDEAVASWHDHGYNRLSSPPSFPSQLSGFPAWHRITPTAAYNHGASVIAYLDNVFASKGGLRPVLAKWFAAQTKHVFTTEMFVSILKEQGADLNFDFDAFFKKQVYGTRLAALPKRVSVRA